MINMKGRYNLKLNKLKLIMEVILIFSVTALIGMIIWDYLDMKKSSKYADSMINEIDKIIEENKDNDTDSLIIVSEVNNSNESNDNSQSDDNRRTTVIQTQSKTVSISGVKVYGKIKIDKIGIEYPIIEYSDANALWKSICKITSVNIDGTSNLCLAGHNMRNLTMFGNLRRITNGDKIEITDLKGKKYIYDVYDKFYIEPNEVSIMNPTNDAIVTLITCNDTSDKRLIVRGRLVS